MKKIKIINVFIAFGLSFAWHFLYKIIPFSWIFPVNESIWEHMKIIFYSLLIVSIIEYFIYQKKKISFHNYNISLMVKSILGIMIYLIIFIPVYLIIGENMIFAISLMFGTYALMEYISYKILNSEELGIKTLPLIIVVLGAVLLVILTYYPLHNFIFFDSKSYGYGILK